jgi:flagella basal body P-ring formation protein FlgA
MIKQNYLSKTTYPTYRKITVLLAYLFFSPNAWPQTTPQQDLQQLREQAIQYLKQLPGISADSQIKVSPVDPQLKLSNCTAIEFFLPNSSHQRGNLRVGARCSEPQAWSIYLGASILESKTYFVTRKALAKDHSIQTSDLVANHVFDAQNSSGFITDPEQITGRILTHPLAAGVAVRQQDLRSEPTLQRGQTVRIVAKGAGFTISNQGQLLANATAGQSTRVLTASKQIITGIARTGGIVEVAVN